MKPQDAIAGSLFSSIERNSDKPARRGEPEYAYLDKSGGSVAENIRSAFDLWFSHVPHEERGDLRGSFCSPIDRSHWAAAFNLVLHEVLIRLGASVTAHPSLRGTTKRPDFLILDSGKPSILEATIETAEATGQIAGTKFENDLFDARDTIPNPGCFLSVEVVRLPDSQPPTNPLLRFVRDRLSELDLRQLTETFNSFGADAMPKWHYRSEGLEVHLSPWPMLSGRHEAPTRLVGIVNKGSARVRGSETILAALEKKASRYGDPEMPYVIAIDAMELGCDDEEVASALFGLGSFELSRGHKVWIPGGLWCNKDKSPRYARVSAVLYVYRLFPSRIAECPLRLWHNPWARFPYRGPMSCFPEARLHEESLELTSGASLGHILELPPGWP